MERILNEATADEKRQANVAIKIGDFGTGGRVYTKYKTRPAAKTGNDESNFTSTTSTTNPTSSKRDPPTNPEYHPTYHHNECNSSFPTEETSSAVYPTEDEEIVLPPTTREDCSVPPAYYDAHHPTRSTTPFPTSRSQNSNNNTTYNCDGDSLCGFLVLLLSYAVMMFLYFSAESSHYNHSICLEEIQQSAMESPSPIADPVNEGRLIHVYSPNPVIHQNHPSTTGDDALTIKDPFFHIPFPKNHVLGRRVTEYCQWMEQRHSEEKIIGKEPDTCQPNPHNQEVAKCLTMTCTPDHCDEDCCIRVPGNAIVQEDIWYTYHKGWRSSRIPSLLFDNPAAYHNPQRDPAPSIHKMVTSQPVSLTTTTVEGEKSLHINVADIESTLEPWTTIPLTTQQLSDYAIKEGFSEVDHKYLYSRVPKDGAEHPLIKAAASYLVDGVIDVNNIALGTGMEEKLGDLDWITKGTCHAGDIRVHLEGRALPREGISIIAQQQGNQLVPYACSSSTNDNKMLLVRQGQVSLHTMTTSLQKQSRGWTMFYRVLFGLMLCGFLCWFAPILVDASGMFVLALTVLVVILHFGLIWSWIYGWRESKAFGIATAVAALVMAVDPPKQPPSERSSKFKFD